MSELKTVSGTYGPALNPCEVFIYENRDGTRWYACEGSKNVNLTPDKIRNGVNVERLTDIDAFTWPNGVRCLDELEIAVEC